VVIPEKLVPHFKPGKALRESVDLQVPVEDAPVEKAPATGT
jgi:integration host factor subunit beta